MLVVWCSGLASFPGPAQLFVAKSTEEPGNEASRSHCMSIVLAYLVECCMTAGAGFNPLTTEFFPPRQHIFMHSAHTTFVGTPLPQHSLISGQTWWGPHTWRDPSGNTVNDIHDPPQAQQSEVKGGCQPDFRPAFP